MIAARSGILPRAEEGPAEPALDQAAPAVEVRGLSAGYDDRLVVHDLSFTVPRGRIVCLVGGSGCGKSTVIRTLVGLLKPMAGTVRVLGRDPLHLGERERIALLRRVGMLFQGGALLGSLSVGDNVALALREHTDLPDGVIRRIVEQKLALVGLRGRQTCYRHSSGRHAEARRDQSRIGAGPDAARLRRALGRPRPRRRGGARRDPARVTAAARHDDGRGHARARQHRRDRRPRRDVGARWPPAGAGQRRRAAAERSTGRARVLPAQRPDRRRADDRAELAGRAGSGYRAGSAPPAARRPALMATRAQQVRLGVFIVLATLLFVVAVGALAGLRLWNPRDRYFVRYHESVSGLASGAAVNMQGVRVGTVERVLVDDVETVRVRLALDPGTPIKADTRAVVASIGLTGLRFVELSGSSRRAPRLHPNGPRSEIRAGSSLTETITGRAIDVSQKIEQVANNLIRITDDTNRERLGSLLRHADQAAEGLAALLERERVGRLMTNLDRSATAMARAASAVDQLASELRPGLRAMVADGAAAMATLQRTLQRTRPQAALDEVALAARALRLRIEQPGTGQALNALRDAALTLQQLGIQLTGTLRRSDPQLARLLSVLQGAAGNLRAFAQAIRDRPSLLLRGEAVKERSLP
ncbi:MAG: ATP-binding cassette domain-containing protein [Proteobacteria bacterium]|nr:ATP-binding cassette domain-containing protein [Pseudomonadota bacterium]